MGELYNSFKIGNIDLVSTSNLYYENYIGTIGYNKKDFKGKEFDFIALNTQNNVLSHTEVRKAILLAIDKISLIANVYNNKYYSVQFPLDSNNWLYNYNASNLGYNPSQASDILSENGWEFKNNVWRKTENYTTLKTNLNLVVNSSNSSRVQVAEMIKEQLKNVGINITIKKVSDSQYQSYLDNKNYDMIIMGTRNTFSPNLNTFLGDNNFSKYNNDEMLNLISEVKNITNTDLLLKKYQRIYEIYYDEIPFISLFFNRSTLCYSPNLMGEITPNCFNIFYNIEKWYRQY